MVPDLHAALAEPAATVQLLDEHHLVVTGRDASRRAAFASTLAGQLETIDGAEVIRIDGHRAIDVAGFCGQLERRIGFPRWPARSIADVIDGLRAASTRRRARYQYLIWSDADVLLGRDPVLFGGLANAIFGVAAEREHVSPEDLVLLRAAFLGGRRLAEYAEHEDGAFRTWLLDDDVTPFWEAVSCVEQPPVLNYRLP